MVHAEICVGTCGFLVVCKPTLVFSFDPKLNNEKMTRRRDTAKLRFLTYVLFPGHPLIPLKVSRCTDY